MNTGLTLDTISVSNSTNGFYLTPAVWTAGTIVTTFPAKKPQELDPLDWLNEQVDRVVALGRLS